MEREEEGKRRITYKREGGKGGGYKERWIKKGAKGKDKKIAEQKRWKKKLRKEGKNEDYGGYEKAAYKTKKSQGKG